MATVEFTVAALTTAFEHEWRNARGTEGNYASRPRIRELHRLLRDARAGREAGEALRRANELIDGHGVEAIRVEGAHVDNYHGDIVGTYVNTGDTYSLTIVHDSENNSFHLTTFGDWVEAYERAHPQLTAWCSGCGEGFADPAELDTDGRCDSCREPAEDKPDILVGRVFNVEVITVTGGPWEAKATWSLNKGLDPVTLSHLLVTPPGMKSVYTTPGMLRARSFGTRLYEIGTLRTSMHLTKESVSAALVELDRFYETSGG